MRFKSHLAKLTDRFRGVPGGRVRTRLTVRFYCRNTAAVALFILFGGVFVVERTKESRDYEGDRGGG